MAISVFDLFTIGIGPSSSHTVGPMRAARMFAEKLAEKGLLADVYDLRVQLYGSLSATGRGHGMDKAVILGLTGFLPETVDVDAVPSFMDTLADERKLSLLDSHTISFDPKENLRFEKRESLPGHPNGLRCVAFDQAGAEILQRVYYSVGGGFVVKENETDDPVITESPVDLSHPFESGAELLAICDTSGASISDIMLANESVWRDEAAIRKGLLEIWATMQACVERGCQNSGLMPGLKVTRRAADLHK